MKKASKQLRVHIGAHKTATTHLQYTLRELLNDLEEYNISYIPLDIARPRLIPYYPKGVKGVIYRKLPDYFFKQYLKKVLFKDINIRNKIILSEENILGSPIDLLDVEPYKNFNHKIKIINLLSRDYETTMFLSIRSFAQVLPGAYITELRFNPKQAIAAKNALVDKLEQGLYPSWYGVIKRLVATCHLPIKIWTQEDYRKHSASIIKEYVGEHIFKIPTISPPVETKTPSFSAVAAVEEKVRTLDKIPHNWTSICDQIYSSLPSVNSSDKYTFLNEKMINDLTAKYQEDLKKLRGLLPGSLIEFDD